MFNEKEYKKQWVKNNPEKVKECQKRYREKHKEEINKRKKQYYIENCEKISEYWKKYREENREELQKRNKEYCRNNPEKRRKTCHQSYKKRYKKRKQLIDDYKLLKGCAICGYNKCVAALDFHHKDRDDKEFDVAKGLAQNTNLKQLKEEIEKCDVLCANCHRELHDKEREDENL